MLCLEWSITKSGFNANAQDSDVLERIPGYYNRDLSIKGQDRRNSFLSGAGTPCQLEPQLIDLFRASFEILGGPKANSHLVAKHLAIAYTFLGPREPGILKILKGLLKLEGKVWSGDPFLNLESICDQLGVDLNYKIHVRLASYNACLLLTRDPGRSCNLAG